MEPSSDYALIDELRAMRPSPSPSFAAELDERAAAGFPRGSASKRLSAGAERLRSMSPRRALVPAGGFAVVALAVATAVALGGGSGDGKTGNAAQDQFALGAPTEAATGTLPQGGAENFNGSGPYAKRRTGPTYSAESAQAYDSASSQLSHVKIVGGAASAAPENLTSANLAHHRLVERGAQLDLAASAGDVESDASQVSATVHRFDGIVMRSNTTEGRNAGAYFSLLIPGAKLGDALDALSLIDRVSSREESSADITAPTVTLADRVKESEARGESLLGQLAATETEAGREAIEAELVSERRQAAAQRERLARLHRRANFSSVEVRIETARDGASGSGSWGVDNALHDAGRVLSAAAGILLIGLAVLGPIALIAFLVWLARRAWLSHARRRALD
jgi:hypothetical protein